VPAPTRGDAETAIQVSYVLTDAGGVLRLRNYLIWEETLRAVEVSE
jgi:hypothetical protein